ncbi:hypothetical protein KEM52_001614 [Ascosphaera acerosa]|nr:hypothetical protein KEM52_001614 [Ascosphaera acerosa]
MTVATPAATPTPSEDAAGDAGSLAKPRLLCLHGGGSNSQVFRAQLRSIRHKLEPRFRLVYVDGPFLCPPGPGVGMVYQHLAPFRRWLRWLPEHPEVAPEEAVAAINRAIARAVAEDDAAGASGECVGLLGFSQGATVAASVLLRQQRREQARREQQQQQQQQQREGEQVEAEAGLKDLRFRFAVLFAGRAPLVQLASGHTADDMEREHLRSPADLASTFSNWPEQAAAQPSPTSGSDNENDDGNADGDRPWLLRVPTVHVHGSKDEGLPLHRKLLELYCQPGSTELVQWCGDHRLPLRAYDVEAVVEQILSVARRTGALPSS